MTPTLSVCCMTGGADPGRVAAILQLFRELADEIVLAVDDRRLDEGAGFGGVADKLLSFPFREPGDRPIPWLIESCSGRWILNIDDDEVPSPALIDELPQLLGRADMTHAWIARRWLFPDETTYLDERPWAREYQLRLVLADARFLQFSDEFHRPLICHGPARFVEAPLWHLDAVLNDPERRRAKALAYERARRGMRANDVSHNSGFYVPELRPGAATVPVPPADLAAIRDVLERSRGNRTVDPSPQVERATRRDVDRVWPGEPYDETLYRARLELAGHARFLVAGVQQTIDVTVENLSEAVWRWGRDAVPEIRLSYSWRTADGTPLEVVGLRTPLPCDLPPGERLIVPLHVLPPVDPGRYRLDVDLVHEHVRWFGCSTPLEIEVRPRRRIAVAGAEDAVEQVLDTLLWSPELEPVRLRPDKPVEERFGHPQIAGLGGFLLGGPGAPTSRATTVARTVRLLAAAYRPQWTRSAPPEVRRFVCQIRGCSAVVVAGTDWDVHARWSRELWRLAATVAATRLAGRPVLVVDEAAPAGRRLHDRALGALVARLATTVPREGVAAALSRSTDR